MIYHAEMVINRLGCPGHLGILDKARGPRGGMVVG